MYMAAATLSLPCIEVHLFSSPLLCDTSQQNSRTGFDCSIVCIMVLFCFFNPIQQSRSGNPMSQVGKLWSTQFWLKNNGTFNFSCK